jgi:hypothetical protein
MGEMVIWQEKSSQRSPVSVEREVEVPEISPGACPERSRRGRNDSRRCVFCSLYNFFSVDYFTLYFLLFTIMTYESAKPSPIF